jgi:hypothetical protein
MLAYRKKNHVYEGIILVSRNSRRKTNRLDLQIRMIYRV